MHEHGVADADFRTAFPDYAGTVAVDALRRAEFARLDERGEVYLDFTGSGLYAASQIRTHAQALLDGVYGNPHSANPASLASTERIEACRARVARFFSADPAEYVVIFTANATQALKLVGESYPFGPGDCFLLTFDNHNSVNGIREFDRVRGARTCYVPMTPPPLRVDEATLARQLAAFGDSGHKLFAFPAQSNFSGVQHPLEWIEAAHAQGWDVLLDAAAFVPTSRLDLSRWKPDFVALSFYKMFGYPTGVGALLARRTALAKLRRPWFAGGTIQVASVQADRHVLSPGAAGFEDGTPDFANIPAIETGLDLLESVGYDVLRTRLRALTAWLIQHLVALRHANGQPLVRIYGPESADGRGATVAFNLIDAAGTAVDPGTVEQRAAGRGISIRTGCFCNPGAGELALGLSRPEIEGCLVSAGSSMTYDDFRRCVDPKTAGAVRVSLGLPTNFADVQAFLELARTFVQ